MAYDKPWTAEDVLTLQAMARKYPPEQIAAELGRGMTATLIKAHDLRIVLDAPRTSPDSMPAGMNLK